MGLPEAALQLLALAWVRWFALLAVQPILRVGFGLRWWSIAAALAGVLAVGDATLVGAIAPATSASGLVLALAAEALLGALLGVCLSLGAHAVLGASAVPATLLRLPLAPWLALVGSLVLVASLELGLHHAALRSSGALQQAFALGDARAWGSGVAATRLPAWLSGMTVLALALATPALLVAAAVELGGAAIARGPGTAPALAQAAVATVRLGAVLVALGASWAIDLPRWAEPALPGLDAGVDRLVPPEP